MPTATPHAAEAAPKPMIRLEGVRKTYRTREGTQHVAVTDATHDGQSRGPGVAGRPVGMWKDDGLEDSRRFARRRRGRDRNRHAGRAVFPGTRRWHGVSAILVAEVAARHRQRVAARRNPRPADENGDGASPAFDRDGRSVRLRRKVSLRTFGRHAATGGDRAFAGPRPETRLDGRTFRRARRPDPRKDEPRTVADLGGIGARPSSLSPTPFTKRCSWDRTVRS